MSGNHFFMVNDGALAEFLDVRPTNIKEELRDFDNIRRLISSPRLCDMYVRELDVTNYVMVGDSFLDQRTMLAAPPQKTVGISLSTWHSMQNNVETVRSYNYADKSISVVQVWPFDPATLDEPMMRLAVALSYTTAELKAESRIVGALNNILSDIGYFIDGEKY